MTTRPIALLLVLTAMAYSPAEAQERAAGSRWSVATSLTYPMVRIYTVH